MAHNDYIERLTEAQLEGRPLPEPTTPEEEVQLQQFHETESLFEEVHTMHLGNDWMSDVWSRIDGESATVTGRDASVVPMAATDDAAVEPTASDTPHKPAVAETDDDDEEDASTGGTVIDASSRFRLWPALSGLAVAAMGLLVVGVFMTSGADKTEEAAQSDAAAPASVSYAEESAAAGEGGSDLRTMARADLPEEPEAMEREITGGAAVAQGTAPPNRGSRLDSDDDSAFALEPDEESAKEVASADQPTADSTTAMPPAGAPTDALSANMGEGGEFAGDDGLGIGGMGGGGIGKSGSRRPGRDKKKDSGGWAAEDEEAEAGDRWNNDPNTATGSSSTTRGGWNNRPRPQRVKLTAGEVDDNTNFADFQQFLTERTKTHLEPMDVSERMFVRVLDQNNRPVPNATVDFQVGNTTVFSAKTYSDGWALFHPRTVGQAAQAEGFDLRIRAGQAEHEYRITRGAKEEWQVRLPIERTVGARQKLDLVFLLDTTQSMQDQIDTLQETIRDVVAEVGALPGQPEVRLGLVVFRDDNEEYVSQVFDFQTDVAAFQRLLGEQEAAGGGDLPERVEVGLHRTVHELSWAPDATRMVFLVGDAGPHKRSLNEFSYAQDAQAAASQGIKIFPVATSGLDDDGEYVFRQLAQYTMGRFIFLTTGAGATSTPHDVKPGSFQPETLDRLVVRLVREELASMELDAGELREMQGQQR